MEIAEKVAVLNQLGTKKLIADIEQAEETLKQKLLEESEFRNKNIGYLASTGEDCREVKAILANLAMDTPFSTEGKKLTVAQQASWLTQQRKTNKALMEAIQRQNEACFNVETLRVYIDVAKKRLESLRGLLALRTAQIEFLKD